MRQLFEMLLQLGVDPIWIIRALMVLAFFAIVVLLGMVPVEDVGEGEQHR